MKLIKLVGLTFDEYLTFERHIKSLKAKLNRANNSNLLMKLLKQIYYVQLYSHLIYGCQLWGQNKNAMEKEQLAIAISHYFLTFKSTVAFFKKYFVLNIAEHHHKTDMSLKSAYSVPICSLQPL